jgi:hypothetical protein
MQSIEFIKNKLGEIANRFPTVQIKYAFNSNIETHIIQFEPFDAYYNMPELDAAWIPFSVEFDRIYQDESIAFIGSDSTLSITDNFDFSWNTQLIDLTIQGFKELLGDTDFRGSFNSFPKTVIWTPSVLPDYNFVINQTEFNFTIESMGYVFFENSILPPKVEVQKENSDLIGNQKYAMAA